jgi:sensor histidine kinase regulating citrate/malate metabolism
MTSIFISAYRNFGVIGTRDIVGIVVSLFVSFFIFIFHDMMTFAYEQKYENQIAKIQLDSRISSDADKEEQYEDALSIQHDWRMFLNVVRNLKSSGYDEEARKYQDSIEKTIDKMTRLVSSPNKVVNAIMNDHLRKAEDLGVSAKFNVSIPETLGIDDVDLTIIIGNVLKNALEALEAVDEGAGRELSITLRQKDEFLVFEVVNTFNPDAVKKRTASRGRGLNNIRKSIKKYGGTFSATPNGTSFTSSAILNSYVRQR